MIDDGMSPALRGLLFRLQQDAARAAAKRQQDADKEAARARARASRTPAPEGQLYLDEAVPELVSRLKADPGATDAVRDRVETGIREGELRATSARTKLAIRQGVNFDPDDCLVTMSALFAWADVDTGQFDNSAAVPGHSAGAAAPAKRHEQKPLIQDRALLKILADEGYPDGLVPRHKGGKPSDLKAACWKKAEAMKDIFTESTFKKTWSRVTARRS